MAALGKFPFVQSSSREKEGVRKQSAFAARCSRSTLRSCYPTNEGQRGQSQSVFVPLPLRVNRVILPVRRSLPVYPDRLYFRTINDKANLQPPVEKSDWFKLVSVDLGNGESGLAGDSVGVVTKWELPDAMAGLPGADFDKVTAAIRAGKWRHHPTSKDWVGNAVAEALDLDIDDEKVKAKIKRWLAGWYAAKSLVVVDGLSDKREARKFVEVPENE